MDRLDLFRRVPKDLTEASIHGSLISIFAIFFAVYLGLSNCLEYISPIRKSEVGGPHGSLLSIFAIFLAVYLGLSNYSCLEYISPTRKSEVGLHGSLLSIFARSKNFFETVLAKRSRYCPRCFSRPSKRRN